MKWIILFLILASVSFLAIVFLIEPKTFEITTQQEEETEKIKIILVGDIMLDRGVEYMVEKYGGGDFKFPFLKIADYLKKANIVFGNLEGVISNKGVRVGSIYSSRVRPEAIEGLSFAGFNVLSLANNHAFDYTREALEDCLTKLSNAEIDYAGAGFNAAEAYSALIKEIGNGSTGSPQAKIGFLAYTNLGPESWKATGENSGIAWISKDDFEKIKNDIKEAKKESDILIVSLHAGEEYTQELTEFQVEFSRMAIEAGADIIAGHHPHVVQRHEKYPLINSEKFGWIFYSLGNFIFDQSFSEETMQGQVVEILIENKKIKDVIVLKIEINQYYQPEFLQKPGFNF